MIDIQDIPLKLDGSLYNAEEFNAMIKVLKDLINSFGKNDELININDTSYQLLSNMLQMLPIALSKDSFRFCDNNSSNRITDGDKLGDNLEMYAVLYNKNDDGTIFIDNNKFQNGKIYHFKLLIDLSSTVYVDLEDIEIMTTDTSCLFLFFNKRHKYQLMVNDFNTSCISLTTRKDLPQWEDNNQRKILLYVDAMFCDGRFLVDNTAMWNYNMINNLMEHDNE